MVMAGAATVINQRPLSRPASSHRRRLQNESSTSQWSTHRLSPANIYHHVYRGSKYVQLGRYTTSNGVYPRIFGIYILPAFFALAAHSLREQLMLFVCCLCDRVCDNTLGQPTVCHRQEHDDRPILSYTCCDDCFRGDPDAIAFRKRNSPLHRSPRHDRRNQFVARDFPSMRS